MPSRMSKVGRNVFFQLQKFQGNDYRHVGNIIALAIANLPKKDKRQCFCEESFSAKRRVSGDHLSDFADHLIITARRTKPAIAKGADENWVAELHQWSKSQKQ